MKKRVNVLICLVGLGIWASHQPALAQSGENVVAKLGAIELTVADVRRLLDTQSAEARAQLTANPQLMDRWVRTEVFRRVLSEEARAKGFDRRPDVAEALERARDQVLVTRYVSDLSKPPAGYPTEQEVAEAYRTNSEEFTVPAQYRVAQIYLANGEGDKKAETVRRRVEDLWKSLTQKPADFDSTARKISEHKPSAEQGGDLGWVALDMLVPEVRSVVTELRKGDLARPVKTATGWHIVRLTDVKPKSLRPLEEVREALVRAMRMRRAQEIEQKYLDDLIARSPLGVNQIALNRLLSPAAAPVPAATPEKKP